jgi:peptide/nickel transport system permease protein
VSDHESEPIIPLRRPTGRSGTVVLPSGAGSSSPARMPEPPPRPRPPGAVRTALRTAISTRLGGAGLLLVAMLVLVAVFADLLASEMPIVCELRGTVYVLPNVTRPATLEGKDAGRIASEVGWAVFPLVAHGPTLPPAAFEHRVPFARPFAVKGHPLGTDGLGRDVFARVVHGARSYLVFALVAALASIALGAAVGAFAGLYGGTFDALLGRAIETVSAFPPLVLVLGIQAAVPRASLATLFFAIALTRWPEVARLVRSEVMVVTTRDYVLAARALGASPWRVLLRHVVPHLRGSLVVAVAVGISSVVLTEASLDFLHVGVSPGAASWGETMSQFRDAPYAWWLLLFPGLFLFATIIGHNLSAESLRDALDPRAR